jgi:hypothetical protein
MIKCIHDLEIPTLVWIVCHLKLSVPCTRLLICGDIPLDHSTNHLQNTWHFVSDLQWRGVSIFKLVLADSFEYWHAPHSQKWWVLCSFAYLRWRRRDVCNFHMIYIDDIIHNCMCVIFWSWKWYIESRWIKWNKN